MIFLLELRFPKKTSRSLKICPFMEEPGGCLCLLSLESVSYSISLWFHKAGLGSILNLFFLPVPPGWKVNCDSGLFSEWELYSAPLPLPAERAPLGLLGYSSIRRQPLSGDSCWAVGGGQQGGVSSRRDIVRKAQNARPEQRCSLTIKCDFNKGEQSL